MCRRTRMSGRDAQNRKFQGEKIKLLSSTLSHIRGFEAYQWPLRGVGVLLRPLALSTVFLSLRHLVLGFRKPNCVCNELVRTALGESGSCFSKVVFTRCRWMCCAGLPRVAAGLLRAEHGLRVEVEGRTGPVRARFLLSAVSVPYPLALRVKC